MPLIPTIDGLKALVTTEAAVQGLDGSLAAITSQLQEDRIVAPNVEQMLTRVRMLRAVAGASEVRGMSALDLRALEECITKTIVDCASPSLPKSLGPFDDLVAWAAGAERKQAVSIFTTNYDLLLEQSFERMEFPFFDGFMGSVHPFFDLQAIEEEAVPPRWTRLWKIHGSINWSENDAGHIVRDLGGPSASRWVVHPSHLKYDESRRMPYLAMMDRLRAFMRLDDAVLVTTGYSYRDAHINEVLSQGLRGNPTGAMVGLLRGTMARYVEANQLALRQGRAQLFARDGAHISREQRTWGDADFAGVHAPLASFVAVKSGTTPPQVEMKLGDFASFGEFLRRLVPGRVDGSTPGTTTAAP